MVEPFQKCNSQFNVATSFIDDHKYKKEMQNSQSSYTYLTELRPPPACMNPGQTFQGLQMSQRAPPPQLFEVELALRKQPLLEADNDYVLDKSLATSGPQPPQVFANRLIIPECKEIYTGKRTKIRFGEFPNWSHRLERGNKNHADYMKPGIDTRKLMKEMYQKYEQKQAAEKKASPTMGLTPQTDCVSLRDGTDCAYMVGSDVVKGGNGYTYTQAPLSGSAIGAPVILSAVTQNMSVANGNQPIPVDAVVGTVKGAPRIVSAVTKQVVDSIDGTVSYLNLVPKDQLTARCNAKFYAYDPQCT